MALRERLPDRLRGVTAPGAWPPPPDAAGRIGIHSGPVVGSIVGVQRYVYDIFGPGVNLAARMEQVSKPMEVTLSEQTYAHLRQEFLCSERGEVEVKGFGTQRVYTLDGELDPPP